MSESLLIADHIRLKKIFDESGIVLGSKVVHAVLKSPVMYVREIGFPIINCAWFDAHEVYRTQSFTVENLKLSK